MGGIKLNKIWHPGMVLFSRLFSPAAFAAMAVLMITLFALFMKPYIGMADNGDYFRILYSNGLFFSAPDYDSQYLGYFNKDYGILQYYNENGATLSSSQSLFIRLALFLNELFYSSSTFDIRFQAAIFTFLYVAAVYLIVESMTWKTTKKQGYLIATVAIFILGDTGYTAYFNSFYSESIVFIMLLLLFSSGLLLYRNRYNDYVLMAIYGISGLLLTTSKQQNAPVGILIGLMSILLLWMRKDKLFRITAGLIAISLIGAGIGTYVLIPKEFVNINKYHAMTRGVLMGATDPEKTLESFGIDKQYAILSGSLYYDSYTPIDVDSKKLEQHFYNEYGFGSVLAYYLTHQDQARGMLNLAANHAFTIRPPAMGNYEKSAGKPFGAQTLFFSGYSELKDALAPKTFGFIVLWLLIVGGMYMPSFLAAIKARQMRHTLRLPLITTMMTVGLSGIVVSIIGAGDADLAKHEFLFTAAFDLVSFVTLADLLSRRLWQNEQA